jgi:hypothetical protein
MLGLIGKKQIHLGIMDTKNFTKDLLGKIIVKETVKADFALMLENLSNRLKGVNLEDGSSLLFQGVHKIIKSLQERRLLSHKEIQDEWIMVKINGKDLELNLSNELLEYLYLVPKIKDGNS